MGGSRTRHRVLGGRDARVAAGVLRTGSQRDHDGRAAPTATSATTAREATGTDGGPPPRIPPSVTATTGRPAAHRHQPESHAPPFGIPGKRRHSRPAARQTKHPFTTATTTVERHPPPRRRRRPGRPPGPRRTATTHPVARYGNPRQTRSPPAPASDQQRDQRNRSPVLNGDHDGRAALTANSATTVREATGTTADRHHVIRHPPPRPQETRSPPGPAS